MVRILLVEDDYKQLRLYEKTLKTAGYDVLSTATIQAAGDMLDRYPFDLCICDVQLGIVGGATVIRQMAKSHREKNIPVLMMSSDMPRYKIECEHYGLMHHLEKPFERKEIIARADALLASHNQADDAPDDNDSSNA